MATIAETFFRNTGSPDYAVRAALAAHALQAASYEEQERLQRILRAWTAYRGELPDPLKVREGKPNDNIKLNYSRLVVDKGASFLFGKPLQFEEAEKEKAAFRQPETKAEKWLRKAWRANKMVTLLQKGATNGGVSGDCFLKLMPVSRLTDPYPRVIVLDPATVKVLTEPDDVDDAYCYIVSYVDINKDKKPVRIEEVTERNQPDTWMISTREVDLITGQVLSQSDAEVWDYAWPPIFHAQNLPNPNCYWGLSDLEDDTIGINSALNFVVSNINRILRHHAHPKTWGKGFTADQMEAAADETIVLPSPEAFLANLEMKSDLRSSIDFYNKVKSALHEITRIPQVSTGQVEKMAGTAGVSLMVMFQPLTEKTTTKRSTYGDMLAELCKRMLELGGFGNDIDVDIQWPALLPRDELQERQVAQVDKQLGVSEDSILSQLGYDPVAEREKSKLDRLPAPGLVSPSRSGVIPFPQNDDGKDNNGRPIGDGGPPD